MNSAKTKGFLAQYGALLIDAGYDIIPIKRGEKRPLFKDWESIRADRSKLDEWLKDGYGRCGVGLITEHTPAVDLDIRDEDLAQHMEEWVHAHVGMAPVRVGEAPKRLLMFRTDEPFSKMSSRIFIDENGRKNQVEILCDGQQFVAFHIHPETQQPFQWLYKDGPHVTPHDELPTLTPEQAQAIIAEFEDQAVQRRWEEKRKSSASREIVRTPVRDVFLEDTSKVDISDEELHAKLLMVPPQPDYDGWLQVGMALYHQYDGGDRGKELWHIWSEQAYPDEYDADEIEQKWSKGNLSIDNKGRAPITARLIIKLANEHQERLATETVAEFNKALDEATTLVKLKEVASRIKKTELDIPTRASLVGKLQKQFKLVTGQTLAIRDARDMLRYENPEVRNVPHWLEDWVYVSGEDKFFNVRTKAVMTEKGFNSTFSRFLLTKQDVAEGRARPERLPSDVALNLYQIPVVSARLYVPGADDIFTINNTKCANTYTDRNVPEVPEKPTKRDLRNIERVKAHFTHLFPDEREARIFLDYIAYIVQNPGKRPGWAVLIQGTEGDGKTFFGVMLGAVLGSDNVRMLNAKTVQGDFNGWAEGQQVVFVEEIRLHGHNRYDVLNQIKPLITNSVIEIHRKGVDPYNVPNMSSYILATNYRDALPLNENDSRYFVLFSRFQTKLALDAFKVQNPSYYDDLYAAIEESAGAIRGWLLEHEIGPDFSVGNRAPESRAKRYMAMLAKSEEQQAIEDVLATSPRFDISRTLLSATDLVEILYDTGDVEIPQTRKLNKILSDMGFTYLGKVRVGGRYRRFWSMAPDQFIKDGQLDTAAVREYAETDL